SGDLVIPLRGKVGEIGYIDNDLAGANLTRGVALISVRPDFSSKYVKHYLSSKACADRFLASMNGSALQEITISTLRQFKVSLPSLP
ncbi:restriction endonuclease subunit S, partial [Vibrio cholerae]|nr:restriction endonuclease subunit S [Vibrio cholerae]